MDISTDFRRKMIIRLIEVLKDSPSFCNISLTQLKEAVLNSEHQTFQQSKSKEEYIYYINEKLKKIKQSSPKSIFLQNNMPSSGQRQENNLKTANGSIPPYVKAQHVFGQPFAPQNKFQTFANQFDNSKRNMELNNKLGYQDKPVSFPYQAPNPNIGKLYGLCKEFSNKSTPRHAESNYSEQPPMFSGLESSYKFKQEGPVTGKEPAQFSNKTYGPAHSIVPIKAKINSEIFQSNPRPKNGNQDMARHPAARSPAGPMGGVSEKKPPNNSFYTAHSDGGDPRFVDQIAKKHPMVSDSNCNSNFVRADTSRVQNKPLQGFDKKYPPNFQEQNNEQLPEFLDRADVDSKRDDEFYRSKYNSIKFPTGFNNFDGHRAKNQGVGLDSIPSKFASLNPTVEGKESPGYRQTNFKASFVGRMPEAPQKSANRSPKVEQEKYFAGPKDMQDQRASLEDSDFASVNDYNARYAAFGNKTVKQVVKAVTNNRNTYFGNETKSDKSGSTISKANIGLEELICRDRFKSNENSQASKGPSHLIMDNASSYSTNAGEDNPVFRDYPEREIKQSQPSKDKSSADLADETRIKASNINDNGVKPAMKPTNIDYFFESSTKLPFEPLRDNFDLELGSCPRIPRLLQDFLDENGLVCRDVECLSSWKALFDQVFFKAINSEVKGEELLKMTALVIKQKDFIEYPFLDAKVLQQYLEKYSEPKSKIEYEVLIERAIQAYSKKKMMDKDFSLDNNDRCC